MIPNNVPAVPPVPLNAGSSPNPGPGSCLHETEPHEAPEKAISPSFSFFKRPVTNTVPSKEVTLVDIYNLIKGPALEEITLCLRSIVNAKQAKNYKARWFHYVTFSGTFTKRSDSNLIKHSGLLTVDFDDLPDPFSLKQKLLEDEYFETELLFLSPSGKGLKWIIPIDLAKAPHDQYFLAVSNYILVTYRLKIDPSGKDISRACFLCHDPNIYINPKYLLP
jgi:hypothetical protein